MDRKRGEGSPDPEGSGAQIPGGAGLVGSRCRVAIGRNAFADVKSDLRCRRGIYLRSVTSHLKIMPVGKRIPIINSFLENLIERFGLIIFLFGSHKDARSHQLDVKEPLVWACRRSMTSGSSS